MFLFVFDGKVLKFVVIDLIPLHYNYMDEIGRRLYPATPTYLVFNNLLMIQKKKVHKYESPPLIYRYGYKYSPSKQRQVFFSTTAHSNVEKSSEMVQTYQTYSSILEQRLNNIRHILLQLLNHQDSQTSQECPQTVEELLEELLLMILEKDRENQHLKTKNHSLRQELEHYFVISGGTCSSLEIDDSQAVTAKSALEPSEKVLNHLEMHNIRHEQNFQLYRNSEESTKTRSMYKPRVLFEIGKEVKTINQINSELLPSDKTAKSRNNSREPSFQELMKLKHTKCHRMSIEASLSPISRPPSRNTIAQPTDQPADRRFYKREATAHEEDAPTQKGYNAQGLSLKSRGDGMDMRSKPSKLQKRQYGTLVLKR